MDSPEILLKHKPAIDNSYQRFKLPSIKSNFDTSTNPSSVRKYKIRSKSTIREGMASIATLNTNINSEIMPNSPIQPYHSPWQPNSPRVVIGGKFGSLSTRNYNGTGVYSSFINKQRPSPIQISAHIEHPREIDLCQEDQYLETIVSNTHLQANQNAASGHQHMLGSGVRGSGRDRTPDPVKRKFFKNHESNSIANQKDPESEPRIVLRSEIDDTPAKNQNSSSFERISMQNNTAEIDDFSRDVTTNKFSEDN